MLMGENYTEVSKRRLSMQIIKLLFAHFKLSKQRMCIFLIRYFSQGTCSKCVRIPMLDSYNIDYDICGREIGSHVRNV